MHAYNPNPARTRERDGTAAVSPGQKEQAFPFEKMVSRFSPCGSRVPAGRKAIMKRYTTALLTAIAQNYRNNYTHTQKKKKHQT